VIHRKTMGKRMAVKLKEVKATLQTANAPLSRGYHKVAAISGKGYFQYHAVPGNEVRLHAFRHDVLRLWMRQLRRRSQRRRWTWERFVERLGVQIPEVQVLHPYPSTRFAATYPR
jgi:RNA-directed DNA polymerase